MIKKVLSLVCCLFFSVSAVGCNSGNSVEKENENRAIVLDLFDGEEIDCCLPVVREYINNRKNPDLLAQMLFEESDTQKYAGKQNFTFRWNGEAGYEPYTVYVADNKSFENAYTITVSGQEAEIGYFLPGKTYYWKVVDNSLRESVTDHFTVKNDIGRFITAGDMRNVRDNGGWLTESGKTVRYGLLYRGDDPRLLSSYASRSVFEYLGINGELDIRLDSECTSNYFNAESPFLKAGINYFSQIIPGENNFIDIVPNNIGKIFEFLAEESNYPIYYHCAFGKDRTGTLGVLILGLLGVDYDSVMCDYELSSFGNGIDSQPRNSIKLVNGKAVFEDPAVDLFGAVGRMGYVLREKYASSDGQPFSEVVTAYLKQECGVTDEQITSIKTILLED